MLFITRYREEINHGWNPPDVPLSCLDSPKEFRDLNGQAFADSRRATIYRFPWYLSWLYLWYGLKHWYKTHKWPARILYFSGKQKRDKAIFLEVIERPQNYYSSDNGLPGIWLDAKEDTNFDELFESEV